MTVKKIQTLLHQQPTQALGRCTRQYRAAHSKQPQHVDGKLNIVLNHKMMGYNNQPLANFCGLSPLQMGNWQNSSFYQLQGVSINIPNDLSSSPVMRYLQLIIDYAMANGGSFAATKKGKLPASLVKQTTALLPEFAVSQHSIPISLSEFGGSNEDKFNALHYTRIIAKITGIIYLRRGRFHVKKAWQKQYQSQGIKALFKPMLESAVFDYNWGYLDDFEEHYNLSLYWLFMLWRLQQHSSFDQMMAELIHAHPTDFPIHQPSQPWYEQHQIYFVTQSRYIQRFLQYWGFVTTTPRPEFELPATSKLVKLQPLCRETFVFDVDAAIDSY